MSDYVMPEVKLGEWVYFYAHEGAEPVVAMVQQVGKSTLVLWSISPGYGGVERPSVHHKDDPRMAENPEWKTYGTWDHQPRDPKIAILSERVSALERRLEAVEGKKAK